MPNQGTFRVFSSLAGIFFFLGAATGCGRENLNQDSLSDFPSGIVGGTQVTDESPFAKSTVGLLFTGQEPSEKSICSATLIAPNLALTAAHCVSVFEKGWVVFSTKFENVAQDRLRKILKVRIHPQYLLDQPENSSALESGFENESWNDLAIVKFEGELPEGYKPVTLLNDSSIVQAGLKITFAGYGMTSSQGLLAKDQDRGVLRQVELTLTSATFQGQDLSFDRPASGASICNGDSGGSAYVNHAGEWKLIGVISRAHGKECNTYSVATNVTAQMAFLSKTLKSLQSQPD